MVIHGNDILIADDAQETLVAKAKSCEIEIDCDSNEVTNPTSAEWKAHKAGRKSWTIQVTSLVTEITDSAAWVGEVFDITVKVRGTNELLGGVALCTRWEVNAQRGALAVGNFNFVGDGALTAVT